MTTPPPPGFVWHPSGVLIPTPPPCLWETPEIFLDPTYRGRTHVNRRPNLFVPQKGVTNVQHNFPTVGSATWGASVTPGTAAEGTPVQIFASTNFDTYWISIHVHSVAASAATRKGTMDVLIGAATEEVLINDLLVGQAGSTFMYGKRWDFPLYIPAGSRLAVQARNDAATAFRAAVYLYGGYGHPNFRVAGNVETYGVTSPSGTAITPGASGAEGAWAAVTSSSSRVHWGFVPSFQCNDTTMNNRMLAVDIGFGAAASETMIGEGYVFMTNSGEEMSGPTPSMPSFATVAASIRLAMRASCDGVLDAAYQCGLHALS